MKLTDKQLIFCQEYLVDLNAAQAAIRAGYCPKNARQIGSENLTKLDIQQKIQSLMDERAKKTEITAGKIIQELAKIAFAEINEQNSGNLPRYRDKIRALELLGRHQGMFKDVHELSGKDGKPFEMIFYMPENHRD